LVSLFFILMSVAVLAVHMQVNSKKVSSCGSTGHSRCGEAHKPVQLCRMRDRCLKRNNPFSLQVWFAFPFKYKSSYIWHGV
jgi:hypothetical protein